MKRHPEIVGPVRTQVTLAQQQLAWHCRQAELNLSADALGGGSAVLGPEGQKLPDWLGRLQEKNRQLARECGFDDLRAEAFELARARLGPPRPLGLNPGPLFFSLTDRGTPYQGVARADASPPRLELQALASRQRGEALTVSGEWLGLLGLLWLLSLVPFLLAWARRLCRNTWSCWRRCSAACRA